MLKHGVVLCQNRDDDSRVSRPLAFVNRRGVGQHQRVEFLLVDIDTLNVGNVAGLELLIVIFFYLHNFVAWCKYGAEALHLVSPQGVQGRLKLDIKGAGTDTAPVHRTENLNVPNGAQTKPVEDPVLDHGQNLSEGLIGAFSRNIIEIALAVRHIL